jgi:hypothetical protein
MAQSPARYFAPTYFAPLYFWPLVFPGEGGGSGGGGGSVTGYRDTDAYSAMIATLKETKEFAAVFFGITPDQRSGGSDALPAVVITPGVWSEIDDSDPIVVIRHIAFALTVIVREDDPFTRFDLLDRLSSVVQDALDGSDLGGGCLPPLTKTRRGQFLAGAGFPEQSAVIHGEFTYLIPYLDGHTTAPFLG